MTTQVSENLEQMLEQAVQGFPQIVRVRQSISADADGDPSVNVLILLSDAAVQSKDVAELAGRISGNIFAKLRNARSEYIPYVYFRSESEQKELKDPEWE